MSTGTPNLHASPSNSSTIYPTRIEAGGNVTIENRVISTSQVSERLDFRNLLNIQRLVDAGTNGLPRDLFFIYSKLVSEYANLAVKEESEKIMSRASYLASLAGVASFLAGVQISFIAITPGSKEGNDLPTDLPNKILFIFSFSALAFDVLGALSALLISRTLRAVNAQSDLATQRKAVADHKISRVIQLLETGEQAKTIAIDVPDALVWVRDASDVLAHFSIILKSHMDFGRGSLLLIILGVLCFFTSVVIWIVTVQPLTVWIPVAVVVAVSSLVILRNEIQEYWISHSKIESSAPPVSKEGEYSAPLEVDPDRESNRSAPSISQPEWINTAMKRIHHPDTTRRTLWKIYYNIIWLPRRLYFFTLRIYLSVTGRTAVAAQTQATRQSSIQFQSSTNPDFGRSSTFPDNSAQHV